MIYDISLPLTDTTIVYPGNPDISITAHHQLPKDSSNISRIDFGSHSGTHIDAPRHADNKAMPIDKIPLNVFVGPCRVLDMTHCNDAVRIKDLTRKPGIRSGDRILVKTKNSLRGFDAFYDDYVYLDGDGADFLAGRDIALFGIDYLSVKQRGSKDFRPHTSLLNKNVPIFEGLDLKNVPAGEYYFIGLPLKFIGIDGSPARAVLVTQDEFKQK